MPATIERLSADQWVPPWIRHQHLTRYEWACQFTAGGTVIDPRELRNALLRGLALAEGRRSGPFRPVRSRGVRP